MYHRFLTFIKKEKLLKSTDRLLLGVSGGVDSMVLAHLVLKTGLPLGIAHVNYRLRGKESDQDAELVETWCKTHQVPFYLKQVDPAVYAGGKSVQMVAREIRYAFYEKWLKEESYTKILTAHNANDNLETVLFNLTKGTGIAGLTGIATCKESLVRPLLFATKEEIYAYAKSEQIVWREDRSNQKNDYSRNLIRNEVIPRLKEINPSLESTFKESLTRFSGAAELVQEAKAEILKNYLKGNEVNCELLLHWISQKNKDLLLLSEIIKEYGFNFQDAKDLFQAVHKGHSGALFYSPRYEINLDRNRLLITRRGEDASEVDLNIMPETRKIVTPYYSLWFEYMTNESLAFDQGEIIFLNADKIDFPLKVRNWSEGDWFVPLGMPGKKKVSDFMIDSKIAVSLKRKVLVLESGGDILWVIGHRIDDRYKITPTTKKVLKIKISYA